jgi:phosphatidylglycerophosphate synthase
MVLYKNRERFSRQNTRLGNVLKILGVSPNQWTALSIVFAIVTFYLLAKQQFAAAALVFALAALFDIFDGAVARATNKANRLGAYLDTVVDRYVEFFVIAGLLFAGLPPYVYPASLWLLLYIFGSVMTTYAKAAAERLGTGEVRGGFLERAERMALLFTGIALAALSKTYLTYVIMLLAVLSNLTALQRIRIALRLVKKVK